MDHNVVILSANLALSTFIFWIAAKVYILPNVHKWRPKDILLPILLLHSLRHLGLLFLASGVVYAGMPVVFARPAAVGDFVAALLALSTIPLLLRGHTATRPMLWTLTIFGTIDFLMAIGLAVYSEAAQFMGAAWWIPAMWVPAALVTHYVTYRVLMATRNSPVL
jgi:hypothetical protein